MTKTHTIYDAMPFPDYEFREYPKHIHPAGPSGRFVEVADEEEELAALTQAEAALDAEPDVRPSRLASRSKRLGLSEDRDAVGED